MMGYVKHFDSKTMSVKVDDNKLLKKYNKVWGKVVHLLNIVELDSDPVYGDNNKHIKTKIKMKMFYINAYH